MSKALNMYIQSLRKTKKKRRQLACFVTALSVFVSGGVFWQLRGIGTAMVDENLPSADDSGTDVTLLSSSELETQDVWEATIPPLTDIAGENLARIAESQLGYTESSVNFVHSEDGETHSGYTRYGAWYGNPYGDWNTTFTYFCMNYAGIRSDDIPYGSGCWAWSLELGRAELITPVSRGSPARGDILLIDSDLDGKADRSCIVTAVSEDETPEISAIEGDVDGVVALTAYPADDERLLGIVSLADIVPEPPILPDEPAEVDFSAESESGISVEAHADWDAFPPDTEMFLYDISQDEAIQAAADHFGGEAADDIEAVAVDITFRSPDGEELEPAEDSQVRVSIALPEEQSLSGGEFSLLHVSDDGDVVEVADAEVTADGADFVAESFSVYIVTQYSDKEKDKSKEYLAGYGLPQGTGEYEGFIPNQWDRPYILRVGDKVKLFSYKNNCTGIDAFWLQHFQTPTDWGNHSTYTATSDNTYQILERTAEHTYNWEESEKIFAEYIATKAGYAEIHHRINEQDEEIFCVRVLDDSTTFTHADMEIADEGIYTFVEDHEDGTKTVKVYKAFVDGIHGNTRVYGANNSLLSEIPVEAYLRIGSPGQPQYEVTSAYYADNNSVGPLGWVQMWSEPHYGIKFNAKATEKVVFDVQLRLRPDYQYTLYADDDTTKHNAKDFRGSDVVIPSTEFTLTGQSLIDAMNKCPMSNGFDFTIKLDLKDRIKSYSTKPQATKTLHNIGIPLHDGQFKFELVEVEQKALKIGENNSDTNVYSIPTEQPFSHIWDNDVFRAYKLMNFDEHYTWGNGLNNVGLISGVPNNSYDFGSLIDNFNKGLTTNPSENEFYHILYDNLNINNAISPNNNSFSLNAGFYLFQKETVVDTVTNDVNGNIVFSALPIFNAGIYHYYIREVEEGDPNVAAYDTKLIPVTVTVTKNASNKLEASIAYGGDSTTFTNTLNEYTLPATGGAGELPYIVFGSAMLAGAFTLLFIRRKKEAAR